MNIHGHCHCKNVSYELTTQKRWDEVVVRICRCEFCLRHRPRHWADPDGSITIAVETPEELVRYRFGHGTADFAVCRRCGVFCFAVAATDGQHRAVANLNLALARDDSPRETFLEVLRENEQERTARRSANWTPMASNWPPR